MTEEEIADILYEENDNYEPVTTETVDGQRRWNTQYSQVFKKIDDGTFWEISWSRGSTEYQDNGPEDLSIVEVVPKQITITKYVMK